MIFKQTKAKAKKLLPSTEKVIHSMIADYINMQYPSIIFLSDPSGMRLSIGLRNEVKRKRCKRYKIPDLIILQPSRNGLHGLILEVKKQGEKLYKKDGVTWVDEHVEAQAKSLYWLKELGYAASFVIGFQDAKDTIDQYLKS